MNDEPFVMAHNKPEIISKSSILARWWPRVMLIILVFYYSRGIFPCVPVEGDEQGVLNGVISLQQHRDDFQQVAYLYPIQPGTYKLIYLTCAIGQVTPIVAYVLWSALGAGLFIYISSLLVARLCGCRPVFIALGFMGAQEMCTAGYYANSSALAAPLLAAALLVALSRPTLLKTIFAACLIAVAGWIRLDVLLLSPAFLPLLAYQSKNYSSHTGRTVLIAATAAALLGGLLWMSHVSLAESWKVYSIRDGTGELTFLWRLWWITTSPAWSLVALAGLVGLIIKRQWWLLCVIGFAITPTLLVYGENLTTTKYLYYIIPFILLPGYWLLKELTVSSRRAAHAGAAILFSAILVEAFFGVRTSNEALRRFDPAEWTLHCDLHLHSFQRPIQIGLGEGEILPTADAFRLRGACFHMPQVWRREKLRMAQLIPLIQTTLFDHEDKTIITSTYLSAQVLVSIFISNDGVCTSRGVVPDNPSSTIEEWVVGNRFFHTINVNHTDRDSAEFARYSSSSGKVLFLNDRGNSAAWHLGAISPRWSCLLGCNNALLSVYRSDQEGL